MRVLRLSDASALAAAYLRNREHLAPWNPIHPEEYYAEAWQAADMSRRLVANEAGDGFFFGLFAGETVVGRFNLAGIVRGPFQSGVLSYWVDYEYAGHGLASAAVRVVVAKACEELGLHRIEATALLHNVGSQQVLLKAGFQQIGMAPRYLQIVGSWQDHNLIKFFCITRSGRRNPPSGIVPIPPSHCRQTVSRTLTGNHFEFLGTNPALWTNED